MNAFTPEDLLTLADVLFDKGYTLLAKHPGDAVFEKRAQELFLLAGKAQEQWHAQATNNQ